MAILMTQRREVFSPQPHAGYGYATTVNTRVPSRLKTSHQRLQTQRIALTGGLLASTHPVLYKRARALCNLHAILE